MEIDKKIKDISTCDLYIQLSLEVTNLYHIEQNKIRDKIYY